MNKVLYNINRLKKYFQLVGSRKEVYSSDLLSSNESLKNFGRAWNQNSGGDVMMMIALAEQQFASENTYNENEMGAVKVALSKVAKFMRNCGNEWDEYEKIQASRRKK